MAKRTEHAVYKAVMADQTKPKRHRRTKAEMQALRNAAAQAVVHTAVDPGSIVKPKRRRRTKAEMQALREQTSKGKLESTSNKTEVDNRKAFLDVVDEAAKAGGDNKLLLRFEGFELRMVDVRNIGVYKTGTGSLLLGYYPNDNGGFVQALTLIGQNIINTKSVGPKQANALSQVNTILDALHKFKVFLSSKFLVKKSEL